MGRSRRKNAPDLPPHPDDDPDWSVDERRIANYLREPTIGYEVAGGGVNEHNERRYDFTLDQRERADGKTPLSGASSATITNRARESIARGGQARVLVFDLREADTPCAEAKRGCARITGMYGQSGVHGHLLDRIVVIGRGYYLEEVL